MFADLGFEPHEAAALKAESQRIISEKLAIKDAPMSALSGWIESKNLKQVEAAEILGITRPRASDLVNKIVQPCTEGIWVGSSLRAGGAGLCSERHRRDLAAPPQISAFAPVPLLRNHGCGLFL